ncbi:ROK family protein [Listeria floridensis]|uniref:ROK family protein n=1 Tax=Listeria floridensis TaxID=1494962 RepID=UPI0004B68499|nr:ROK family protein [Listeria floridensis]
MLTFNKKAALLIAFDIGYNYIEALLAYIDGTVIKSISKRDLNVSKTNVISQIEKIVLELQSGCPASPHGIVGMTLAIHGQVDDGKAIFTPYYDLDQIDLLDELDARYEFPVYMENEANLSALGEYTFSSEYQKLISISMHSGIGAGIVEYGKLQSGNNGKAGEIGHMIFQPHGRTCPCGNKGCLEQYGSNKVIYDEFATMKGLTKVDSDVLRSYYRENDPDAAILIQKYADILSTGINNIIMMYAPEIVVINSSVARKIPQTIELISARLTSRFTAGVSIRNTYLEENSTLYGALALSAQKYLNIEELKLQAK